jgi:hypothetical protein
LLAEGMIMIKVYHNRVLLEKAFFPIGSSEIQKIQYAWKHIEHLILVARIKTHSLDEAFMLTNSIDKYWGDNPEVELVLNLPNPKYFRSTSTNPKYFRSTSTGDVMETEDGKQFLVDDIGFLEIPDKKLADVPLDKLPLNLGIHPALDELIEKRLKEAVELTENLEESGK